jgi:hypothetical protein
MNLQRLSAMALASIAVLAASGCAAPQPAPGQRMGDAVSLTMAQQLLNPQAGINRDPVLGLDGKAAKSGFDAFQKSYRAPEPPTNAFTIGIGGAR